MPRNHLSASGKPLAVHWFSALNQWSLFSSVLIWLPFICFPFQTEIPG